MSALARPDFDQSAPRRRLALADLDNDGRVDPVVLVLGGPAKIFRNLSENSNHWILFQLNGEQQPDGAGSLRTHHGRKGTKAVLARSD